MSKRLVAGSGVSCVPQAANGFSQLYYLVKICISLFYTTVVGLRVRTRFKSGFLTVVERELEMLRSETRVSRRSAFSAGTSKNLKVQFKTFMIFCLYFNLLPVPASLDTLSLYAQFLSRSFKTVSSIKNYVNGVRVLHLSLDASFPSLDYSYQLLLRGLRRLNPHEEHRALPITPAILLRIFNVIDLEDSCHRALWSCFLLSFYLFARKSNMVPPPTLPSVCPSISPGATSSCPTPA